MIDHCSIRTVCGDEPRPLPIPIIQPIDMDDVAAVAPEYEGSLISTVMDEISTPDARLRYLHGLRLVDAQWLDEEMLDIPPDAIPPSHLLVAHDGRGGPSVAYPCHDLLLAAHFSLLPPCPTPMPQPEGTQHRRDITLPYPPAFDVIREYIYTHSTLSLFDRLLRNRCTAVPSSALDFQNCASTFANLGETELKRRAFAVWQVYANGLHLGLVDGKFWHFLHLASCLLARAFEICREARSPTETVVDDVEEEDCRIELFHSCYEEPLTVEIR